MAKLLDTVEEPGSKAAIVWVVGEYCTMIAFSVFSKKKLGKKKRIRI